MRSDEGSSAEALCLGGLSESLLVSRRYPKRKFVGLHRYNRGSSPIYNFSPYSFRSIIMLTVSPFSLNLESFATDLFNPATIYFKDFIN